MIKAPTQLVNGYSTSTKRKMCARGRFFEHIAKVKWVTLEHVGDFFGWLGSWRRVREKRGRGGVVGGVGVTVLFLERGKRMFMDAVYSWNSFTLTPHPPQPTTQA